MTLLAEIQAKVAPAILASKDVQAIADAFNVDRTKIVPTEIGNGVILETMGLVAGNTLLDAINAVPDFRHVKPLLEQGRLRVDSALVRATLDSLVPAVLTQAQADALKALAVKPDLVSPAQVANVLDGGL